MLDCLDEIITICDYCGVRWLEVVGASSPFIKPSKVARFLIIYYLRARGKTFREMGNILTVNISTKGYQNAERFIEKHPFLLKFITELIDVKNATYIGQPVDCIVCGKPAKVGGFCSNTCKYEHYGIDG